MAPYSAAGGRSSSGMMSAPNTKEDKSLVMWNAEISPTSPTFSSSGIGMYLENVCD